MYSDNHQSIIFKYLKKIVILLRNEIYHQIYPDQAVAHAHDL